MTEIKNILGIQLGAAENEFSGASNMHLITPEFRAFLSEAGTLDTSEIPHRIAIILENSRRLGFDLDFLTHIWPLVKQYFADKDLSSLIDVLGQSATESRNSHFIEKIITLSITIATSIGDPRLKEDSLSGIMKKLFPVFQNDSIRRKLLEALRASGIDEELFFDRE